MADRLYQQEAIDRCRDAVRRGKKRIVLCAPCGAGKGHLAAGLMRSSVAKGNRALFVVHRRELILDMAERVRRNGTECGVILRGEPRRPELPAQVASIQTLSRRDLPPADLVIADECQHATSPQWRRVLDAYPEAVVLGFTATPCRMSGAPLGDLFEELIQVTTPAELVDQGWLVPVRGWAFESPNLRDIPRVRGEFDTSALELLMGGSRVLGNVVGEYQERAAGTKAIVFCVSREHSRLTTRAFLAAGEHAEHLDGETPLLERKAAIERFRTSETRVLCNVDLFGEGFDLPDIQTVILNAPTASLSRYLQRVGRGRRPVYCACGEFPHWRSERCVCGAPSVKRFCRLHDHSSGVQTFGLPDEPRIWTLDKSVRVTKRQLSGNGLGSVKTCTSCFALYAADLERCPECGGVNRARKRLVRSAEGVAVPIEEVSKQASIPPHALLRWLNAEATRKKYKRGWVGIQFKARFGRWPSTKDWEIPKPKEAPHV